MTPAMTKTLKQKNQPQLLVFLLANVLWLSTAALGWKNVAALLSAVVKGDFSVLGKIVAVPALASLVLGLISWAIPKSTKEVLVFWRTGVRRMPSSEAFSRIAASDTRIDTDRLVKHVGTLPTTPEKQSAVWYEIYRRHRNEPSVEDANAAYLLFREMAAIVVVLLAATVAADLSLGLVWRTVVLSLAALLGEYLVISAAARNAGTRLVANVLALESAHEQKPSPKPKATTPRRTPRAQ